MKTILCVSLLLASSAVADEAVDRASIATTISWVNASYSDPSLFTSDFSDSAELLRGVQGSSWGRVVISKAPWGEATIVPAPRTPHFVIRSVRFVTADVAMVDGIDQRNGGASVLFVLKKDGIAWRIASFKRIEDQVKTAP